jgi:hypothetical protein
VVRGAAAFSLHQQPRVHDNDAYGALAHAGKPHRLSEPTPWSLGQGVFCSRSGKCSNYSTMAIGETDSGGLTGRHPPRKISHRAPAGWRCPFSSIGRAPAQRAGGRGPEREPVWHRVCLWPVYPGGLACAELLVAQLRCGQMFGIAKHGCCPRTLRL